MTPAETGQLRSRLDAAVTSLDDVPPQMRARLLMAKACDVALADSNAMGALWMLGQAADLLGGRWTGDTVHTFLETKR